MIVIYTALRALPAELRDSARLDGASEWQIVLRVKVPLVMPAVVMCALFLSLQRFWRIDLVTGALK